MATIILPGGSAARFKTEKWSLQQPSQVNRSPYSGARHVTILGGARWFVEVTVPPITKEVDVKPWRAFLAAAAGRANTFLMYPKNIVSLGGDGTAGETVPSGASSFLRAAGGPTVPAGSYVSFGNELAVLTADSAPSATISFRPPLRNNLTNGVTIRFNTPRVMMSLVEDSFSIEGTEGQGFIVSFAAEEAF